MARPASLSTAPGIGPPNKVIGKDGQPLALELFQKIIAINLIGTFNVMSKFAARLHDADPVGEERGVVVNTASVAAFDGQIGQAAYAASKGGHRRHGPAGRAPSSPATAFA